MAILSRVGIDDVVYGFAAPLEPDSETRIITARCGGVLVTSVYVPNGRSLDSDHYAYKLAWLAKLRRPPRPSGPARRAGGGVRRLQHRPGGP